MHRENLTAYETMPEDLAVYMSQNGPHFNKYAFEFAVSNMYKKSADDKEEEINPYSKAKVDELLANYGIKIKNNHLYDAAYVATILIVELRIAYNEGKIFNKKKAKTKK